MSTIQTPIEIAVGNATLLAVPAVHFRLAFAEEVNRLCRDSARRPDAIAVELGPATAAAVRRWLTELGIGPAARRRLPVMLGLVSPNRYLKPSVRARALALQRETGVPLQDLPGDVLRRELGYSAYATLMLSPTDSIIEAIRCGTELGVPVYGVDLEDMAEPQITPVQIEDPAAARGRVAEYVAANQPCAQTCDDEVDPRRELAMAARLKTLLGRHQRVLFTCGMAHWQRVQARLLDPALRPALVAAEPLADKPFERVLVDPRIAVPYLDRLPAVADAYEQRRPHPLMGGAEGEDAPVPSASLHQDLLRTAYARYFPDSDQVRWNARQRRDWSTAPSFEQLLSGQGCLSLHKLPSFGDIYASARATMSREFCEALARTLLAFPWATPETAGVETTLRPAPEDRGAGAVVLRRGNGGEEEGFTLRTVPGGSLSDGTPGLSAIELPDLGEATDPRQTRVGRLYCHHTWLPWDNLLTGLSWAAIEQASRQGTITIAEPFDGQLLDGIDIKATLRARARGERALFVRGRRAGSAQASADLAEGLPVVWLFDGESDQQDYRYSSYTTALEDSLRYARDARWFRAQAEACGSIAVAISVFAKDNADDPLVRQHDVDVYRSDLRGAVLYHPLFPGFRQFARWFELTRFARNPYTGLFLSDSVPRSVSAELEHRLGTPAPSLHWQDVLVCAAIPYAGQSVTVVAPSAMTLAPAVHRLAKAHAVRLRRVALERFSAAHIRRVRVNYMVAGDHDRDRDKMQYVAGVEEHLGEPQDLYLEMVPRRWRELVRN